MMWAGIGTGIGIVVDAEIREQRTIYVGQTSKSSSPVTRLSPMLRRGTKGLRVTISF
jgi:hypothetical protein